MNYYKLINLTGKLGLWELFKRNFPISRRSVHNSVEISSLTSKPIWFLSSETTSSLMITLSNFLLMFYLLSCTTPVSEHQLQIPELSVAFSD